MTPAPGSLVLRSGEVHIWCIAVGWEAEAGRDYASVLPHEEFRTLASIPDRASRNERLHARWLLRSHLSAYHAAPPASWRFVHAVHGKPALVAAPGDLRFNLSHTAGLIALAFARGHEVGIDAEYLQRPLPKAEDLILSAAERCDLEARTPEQRHERFFELWTLKEALGKGTGLGLGAALDELTITGSGPYHLSTPRDEALRDWQLGSLRCAEHRVSWAWPWAAGAPDRVTVHRG
jgi:4'-phosphopantetheinyl transferase